MHQAVFKLVYLHEDYLKCSNTGFILFVFFSRSIKQLRATAFVSSVLHAMSSLVCCGAFFEPEALVRARYIYRWLENMLCSSEEKVIEYCTIILLITSLPLSPSLLPSIPPFLLSSDSAVRSDYSSVVIAVQQRACPTQVGHRSLLCQHHTLCHTLLPRSLQHLC